MFLTWDFRVLTGMTMANVPKAKRHAHDVAAGLTAEELLLHVGLMALWYVTYRWWRVGGETSSPPACGP